MTHSEQIHELAAALAKAQAQIEGAAKDKTNPHFRSKYADLGNVWDACRKPLTDHGLSVVQCPGVAEDGRVGVDTILLHSSGQWIAGTLAMKPTKDDPQGVGSALTYARRYALSAMVGVAPEDDDGNAASEKRPMQTVTAPPGYTEWAKALDRTLAESGIEAARADFAAAEPAFRDFLTNVDTARYETLKAASKKGKAA